MGEHYWKKHSVSVSFLSTNRDRDDPATIRADRYPDGSVKNSLSADELRDVADMLNTAADELEAHNHD